MARSKPKRKQVSGAGAAGAITASASNSKLSFRGYFVLNAIFSSFCILQLILVRLLLRDFAGLYFFFIFLMVSFLVVSLFDYFAEKTGLGDQIEGSSVPVNEHP